MKSKILTVVSIVLILVAVRLDVNAKPKKPARKTFVKTSRAYLKPDLKKNLEFDFAKSTVRMTYDQKLDRLADVIKQNNYAIALRGHADSIGTFKGNWKLSQKRADAVKEYLVKAGVDDKKIVSTAFGSTKPIASNKSASGRQKNRRVEIIADPINN